MESLLRNLEKYVTCSICLDNLTKPNTIACLHTYCLKCLEEHALKTQRQGQFRCPDCQAEVNIPEGNRFDDLPTGFLQNSLLSLLAVRQSGDGSQINCANCKKKSVEISYCFACEKLLCRDCANAHELFRETAFKGHKVTAVKQFQPADYETLLKRQSFCSQPYHERKLMKFFCLECKACVCQICINTDHKSHDVDPLEKAADETKVNIVAAAELLKEKREVCDDVIREYEETAFKLDSNIKSAKFEVSQAAEQMVARIRQCEREAITTLEDTRVSIMDKLNSLTKQVQSLAKQLEQAVEFADNLVQRSSISDIMQSKQNLEQRFEDLKKTQIPSALPVSSFIKFVSTIAPDSFSLGFVTTNETDVHGSTVEGLTENFQAGLEAEFLVCPKLKNNGDLTSKAEGKFHVEAFVEPSEKVANLTTVHKETENVRLKFVPKIPGPYNITVKINGDKLVENPFTVQVKERRIHILGELQLKGEILQSPRGIAVNSKGLIAVTDGGKHCILIFDKEGSFVRKLGCRGEGPGQFFNPTGVTYLNGNEILVADELNHRIQQFNVQTGNFVKSFGKYGEGDGEFNRPVNICINDEGNIAVVDSSNRRVQVFTTDGKPVPKFGESGPGKFTAPTACIYHKQKLILSDGLGGCLKVLDSTGKFLYEIGEKGKGDGQLSFPWDLCVEKRGDHSNLLVCDKWNGRIQQFTMEGRFTGKTFEKLKHPIAIAVTPDGRILVCDGNAKKIYVLI